MATAVARTDWNDTFANRAAEAFDRVLFVGLTIGLTLWLLLGYGGKVIGERYSKPPVVALKEMMSRSAKPERR